MSGITILAIVGLFIWCGALSRRLGTSMMTRGRLRGGAHADDFESQLIDLTDAHHRFEHEMQQRVMELEERLDFTERMLADARRREQQDESA